MGKKYFYILIMSLFSNINCGNFKIFGPDGLSKLLSNYEKKKGELKELKRSGLDPELINEADYLSPLNRIIPYILKSTLLTKSTPLRNFLKNKNSYVSDITDYNNAIRNFKDALEIQKADVTKTIFKLKIPTYKKNIDEELKRIATYSGEKTFREDMLPKHINEAIVYLNTLFDNDMALSSLRIGSIMRNLYDALTQYLSLFRRIVGIRIQGYQFHIPNPDERLEALNKSVKINYNLLKDELEKYKVDYRQRITKQIYKSTPLPKELSTLISEYVVE